MDLINLIITGILINHLYFIFTTLLVLLFRNFPIYQFDTSSDPINTEDLLKEVKKDESFKTGYTLKEGEKKPEGLFYNYKKKYIGYITNYQTSNNFSAKVHSKIYFYGNLPIELKSLSTRCNEKDKEKEITFIKMYLSSNYYDGSFKDIKLPFDFEPKDNQKRIIDSIIDSYEDHPFQICRALIWGSPGGGKSFIAKLLAKEFESSCCFDIKLLDPGTPILSLWQTVMPSKDKPLIIQIDELDIIIKKIHNRENETEKPHQWLRNMVFDKQSYNTFLSEYLICLPYVIYLFTMNSNPDIINKLDESYIRQNRIDIILPLEDSKKDN